MHAHDAPVVVAFDGSEEATAAVRVAAALFAGRRLIVVSVWEPELAVMLPAMNDPSGMTGLSSAMSSPEQAAAVDRMQRDHATEVADAGAHAARAAGAEAEGASVADAGDVAGTIVGVAESHEACVIVVGSRGRGGVRSMFGSTSRALLRRSVHPVLVVRAS